MMRVIQIPVLTDNYQYLLICQRTGKAVAIDAQDAPALVRAVKEAGVELSVIWNTHHHWDHVGANDELCARFHLPVYCSAYDFENGRVPHAKFPLREGDEVRIGDLRFMVIDIPAHTLGHIAFYGHGAVFCGDTMFVGGCGRLFEGTAKHMYRALAKLAALPNETLVYCMHEYTLKNLEFARTLEPGNQAIARKLSEVRGKRERGISTVPSTIGAEKSYNPFLRTDSAELRASLVKLGCGDLSDPVAVLAAVRELKDRF